MSAAQSMTSFLRLASAVCSGLLCSLLINVTAAQVKSTLPMLTNAHDAHSLLPEQADLGCPIHFRAVATYYDNHIDARHGALFVCDATGCIFAAIPATPVLAIHLGTLVELTGKTGAGDFAPILDQPTVKIIRQSHLPLQAARVSLTRLTTGTDDGWLAGKR